MSEEDKRTCREVIFPFWKGKSLAEACEERLRAAGFWDYAADACITDVTYHVTSGGGDTAPGFDIILFEKGIDGIEAEARRHLAGLPAEGDDVEGRRVYYEAAIEACEGVKAYAGRLADHAEELAGKAEDASRREELLRIAEVNRRVPANPPSNFWEALQSLWTVQSLFSLEANQCSTSLGRVDQYLYPYYARDVESGALSRERAFELFACFMIKCSEVTSSMR